MRRRQPTTSLSISAERTVTISGSTKKIASASASGRYCRAEKKKPLLAAIRKPRSDIRPEAVRHQSAPPLRGEEKRQREAGLQGEAGEIDDDDRHGGREKLRHRILARQEEHGDGHIDEAADQKRAVLLRAPRRNCRQDPSSRILPQLLRCDRPVHSGMLSCFFQGFSMDFVRRSRSARATRLRVECGMITSSI